MTKTLYQQRNALFSLKTARKSQCLPCFNEFINKMKQMLVASKVKKFFYFVCVFRKG
jgi:hypothetical protein